MNASSRSRPSRGPRLSHLSSVCKVVALTGFVSLGACTSLTPTYERPASAVPGQLPVPAGQAAAGLPASPMVWTEFVRDARLHALVQLALTHNRDLRVAALNVQKAEAQLGVTRADRYPTVSAGLNASRAPNTQGVQVNSTQLGLQVTAWELDFFGRLQSLSDSAQAQLMATDAGRRSAELTVVAAVLSADRTLAADTALLSLAERTAEGRQSSLKLTRLRAERGAASQVEQQSAETLTAQAEAAVAQATRQLAQDRNALALLLGQAVPPDLLPPALVLPATSAPAGAADELAAVPVSLDASVLLRRPDVQQAEQQLMGANANIGAARAAFFPRITLSSSVGLVSPQLIGLLDAPHLAWTLASQALLTVFDSGRNQANVKITEISRDIAIAQYDKAVQSAFRDTADALVGLSTWRTQMDAQQRLTTATRELQRLTELRYTAGAASEFERLDAQRSLFAAEQTLIQVRLAEQLNRIALFKVLGG